MTTSIDPLFLVSNQCTDALTFGLDYGAVSADRLIAGDPRIGTAMLGRLGECNIGVWEITPSTTTDVEIDEYFVVLAGEATVTFADGSPELLLRPGTVGRLTKGSQTTWTVSHTLRKIYIA